MGDLVTPIFVEQLCGPWFVPLLPRGRWLLGSPFSQSTWARSRAALQQEHAVPAPCSQYESLCNTTYFLWHQIMQFLSRRMQSPGRTQQHFSRSKNTFCRIEAAFLCVVLKIRRYVRCLFPSQGCQVKQDVLFLPLERSPCTHRKLDGLFLSLLHQDEFLLPFFIFSF